LYAVLFVEELGGMEGATLGSYLEEANQNLVYIEAKAK
jgi:hypothetical protein